MLEEEAKTANLDVLPSSRMSIKMKNKLKKRRASSRVVELLQQSARRSNASSGVLRRRVKTLKRLIPNSRKCVCVDGLFRETADYILALQLKVRVMQTMIDLVSHSGAN
ncbi:hypothetical protein QQ045_023037 [Rhodiola kirilowii]